MKYSLRIRFNPNCMSFKTLCQRIFSDFFALSFRCFLVKIKNFDLRQTTKDYQSEQTLRKNSTFTEKNSTFTEKTVGEPGVSPSIANMNSRFNNKIFQKLQYVQITFIHVSTKFGWKIYCRCWAMAVFNFLPISKIKKRFSFSDSCLVWSHKNIKRE